MLRIIAISVVFLSLQYHAMVLEGDGSSIFKQQTGASRSFAKFTSAMQEVSRKLPATVKFRLPKVVVVGGRSAGKSSLLENINIKV